MGCLVNMLVWFFVIVLLLGMFAEILAVLILGLGFLVLVWRLLLR